MPLAAYVDNVEGLDDGVKALYVQVEDAESPLKGKFILDVAPVGGYMLDNPTPLKTALEKERETVRNKDGLLKKFEGLEPGKVRKDLAKLEELAKIDPQTEAGKIAQTQIDSFKAEMVTKHEEEVSGIKGKLDNTSAKLRAVLITDQAKTAIAEAGGNPKLLLPHVEGAMRVRETETGDFVPEVVSVDGQARVRNGQGHPFTAKDLVEELKGTFPEAFTGSGASGSGAKPNQQPGGGGPASKTYSLVDWQRAVSSERDPVKRAALIKEKADGRIKVTT